jgi:hypothetical protein
MNSDEYDFSSPQAIGKIVRCAERTPRLPYGTVGSRSMRKEKSMKIKNMRFVAPTDDDSSGWTKHNANQFYDSDIICYVITDTEDFP